MLLRLWFRMVDTSAYSYIPNKKDGTLVLGSLLFLSSAAALTCFILTTQVAGNQVFVALLGGGLAALIPIPMLAYRLIALQRAYYRMDRSTLTLHWGLRTEVLPLRAIEWVRPIDDLIEPLRKPRLALPGAYLGWVHLDGLGKVEFMAHHLRQALLVAGPDAVYVISPQGAAGFLAHFRRNVELGSLDAVAAVSVQPSFVLGKLWDSQVLRNLFLSGFLVNAAVLVWTVLLITSRQQVSLGASVTAAADPVSSIRLLLLPVVSVVIWLVDIITGAFFFRLESQKSLAYLVYGGAILTATLILLSLFFVTIHP